MTIGRHERVKCENNVYKVKKWDRDTSELCVNQIGHLIGYIIIIIVAIQLTLKKIMNH